MGAAQSCGLPAYSAEGRLLMRSAQRGEAAAVNVAVKEHPSLLIYANFSHFTAWHVAAQNGHEHVLGALAAHARALPSLTRASASAAAAAATGAAPPRPPSRTPSRVAAADADGDAVVARLVNSRTARDQTPLMLAAANGHAGCVRALLAAGADVWAADRLGARTALHYAARKGHAAIVRLLVEHARGGGAAPAGERSPVAASAPNTPSTPYIDVRTSSGFTPLHHAIYAGAVEAAAMLCAMGASPTAQSTFANLDWMSCAAGSTPLHLAAARGALPLAKMVLKAAHDAAAGGRRRPGAGPAGDVRGIADGAGRLPFQVAADHGHAVLAEALHPGTVLASVLAEDDGWSVGAPSLAALASRALRAHLASSLEAAEAGRAACAAAGGGAGGACAAATATAAAAAAAPGAPPPPPSPPLAEYMRHARGGGAAKADAPAAAKADVSAAADGGAAAAAGGEAGADRVALDERQSREYAALAQRLSLGAARAAAAAAEAEAQAAEAEPCGVCLDAPAGLRLTTCAHRLCAGCSRSILRVAAAGAPAGCPFCRRAIGGFAPACRHC